MSSNITFIGEKRKRNMYLKKSLEPTKNTLIQFAQKCAWCNFYIYSTDKTNTYNGTDESFYGWMVHDSCNIK